MKAKKKSLPGKYAHTQSSMIFQDCGAFSQKSYSLPPIDVQEYISFIKEREHLLTVYANLDVIGDAELTWKNQRSMEDAGLLPLPVYHPLSDDIKWLHKCIAEYDYFAVGGIAHNPSLSLRVSVLDNCWKFICDDEGKPKSKVHGFGLAAPKLMVRYPWFSVDTSSYMDFGQYGMILIPKIVRGEYAYDSTTNPLFVTYRSPKKKIEGMHFDSLTKNEQNNVLKYLKSKNIEFGTSEFVKVEKGYKPKKGIEVMANDERTLVERPIIKGVSNTNFYRDVINFFFYMDVAEAAGDYNDARFTQPKLISLF